MDGRTALNAVNYAIRKYSYIRLVNFFGGEPTLNEKIIEMVCAYFHYLYSRGEIDYVPRFGMTTNCYMLSRRMFHILQEYRFEVSISFDGPREVHDTLRVDQHGRGTHTSVLNNVKKIQSLGIMPEFECTYTYEHYRRGMDLKALMDFFHDTCQCGILHCPMVITDPDSPLHIPLDMASDLYIDAIEYSITNLSNNLTKSLSLAKRLLNSLAAKKPICHYCPAGKDSVTINADGNIYTCFMLMHPPESSIGNINDGKGPTDESALKIISMIEDSDKWLNASCVECWAQSLCFGCIGEDYARGGLSINRSIQPSASCICDYRRKIISGFLLAIARTYLKNPAQG